MTLIYLILSRSNKSIQNNLNEYFGFNMVECPSTSAFSQARKKFSYKYFEDCLDYSYKDMGFYDNANLNFYKGRRLLAIDGSKLRLPDTADIREEFGSISIRNQHGTGEYVGGLCSVLYDVLNNNILTGILASSKRSELSLAREHLLKCQPGDIIIHDRGYGGFEYYHDVIKAGADFICRCSKNAFKAVEEFLSDDSTTDKIVTLTPYIDLKSKVKTGELSSELKVRFIKVFLPTGEVEVLATSLLSKQEYPASDFKDLYHLRWEIETLFDRLKNRLMLENFSGNTKEAVLQDFFSTLLVSNIESELTAETDHELKSKKKTKYYHKVNKSISFNAVREHVLELLLAYDKPTEEELVKKLKKIFRKNTIPIRPDRSFPRNTSIRRSLTHYVTKKKVVF